MSWGSAVVDRAHDQGLDMAAGSGDGTGPVYDGLSVGNTSVSGGVPDADGTELACVRLTEVGALLRQLKVPAVRGDFLAGRVLKCDDPESMLVLLDALYDLFLPAWNTDPDVRAVRAKVAGKHFKLLLGESQELFEIPCDYVVKLKYKYSTWMQALRKLNACPYWNLQDETDHLARKFTEVNIFDDLEVDSDDDKRQIMDNKPVVRRKNNPAKSSRVKFKSSDIRRSVQRFPRDVSPVESDGCDSDSEGQNTRRMALRRPKSKNLNDVEITDSCDDSSSDGDYSSAEYSQHQVKGRSKYYPKDVVAPETFDVDSRGSLRNFLSDFERYFSIKFAGNQKDRCRELGRFLVGEVKDAYDAVGGPLLRYTEMKGELLQWYRSQQVGRTYKRRADLAQACMKDGETFKLYCMRLEKLANRAYPHDVSEAAKQLRRRFLRTVPRWFAKSVEKREETQKIMKPNRRITWADIISVAENEDKKKKKKDLMKIETSIEEPVLAKVATTQYYETPQQNRVFNSSTKSSPESRRNGNSTNGAGGSQCLYCGRIGHVEGKCLLKLQSGKCFCCGEKGHQYRECSQYKKASSSSTDKLVCSSCKGPHLGMNCPLSSQVKQSSKGSGTNVRFTDETGAVPKYSSRSDSGPVETGKGILSSGNGSNRPVATNTVRNGFARGRNNWNSFPSASSVNFEPLGGGGADSNKLSNEDCSGN